MSLWRRLVRRPRVRAPEPPEPARAPPANAPIPLPTEPLVFECRECGKVFEIRRRRAVCPECDSADVELLSE